MAAPVWAVTEDASRQTHAQLSYLTVAEPEATATAMPVLGSLLVVHCTPTELLEAMAEGGMSGAAFAGVGALLGKVAGPLLTRFTTSPAGRRLLQKVESSDGPLTSRLGKLLKASCGGQSFAPGTLVLLASGKAKPISALKPGDKVLAADTATGKDQPEAVTAVEVNHDHDLYDLRVKTGRGTEVIHTTAAHLFWDPYLDKFIPANHLKKGEHLQTPDGTLAVADGGTTPKVHDGWMWDLTVPGNNDHDFYVLPESRVHADGSVGVLVHNENEGCDPYLTERSCASRFRPIWSW